MKPRWLTGLLALGFAVGVAAGQDKTAPDKPAADKPAEKPKKTKPPLQLAGYTAKVVRGFTLYISDESKTHLEDEQYELKPLEVLDKELAGIERVMLPKMVTLLKTVKIFVEWDMPESHPQGGGTIVARYFYDSAGGLAMAQSGKDWRKANNIEILNTKYLTEKWQPGKSRDQIVLLHELSHAVEAHLLQAYVPALKAAFQQAMDRGLYANVKHETGREAKAYAATNDREYFAELSCAYLDRCAYFPFTREELKEYDSVGFQLMEKIWGKGDPRNRKLAAAPPARSPGKSEEKPVAKADDKPAAKPAATSPAPEKDAEEKAARKLELIDILVKNNLKDKARERLQELIKQYPGTDAAEKAQEMLKQLK